MQNGCDLTRTMRCQSSHMANPAVFDVFHIVGSGLWMLGGGVIFKVYEYVQVQYFFKFLVRVVISDK